MLRKLIKRNSLQECMRGSQKNQKTRLVLFYVFKNFVWIMSWYYKLVSVFINNQRNKEKIKAGEDGTEELLVP